MDVGAVKAPTIGGDDGDYTGLQGGTPRATEEKRCA
jgi:hypothetical protein